MNFPDRSIQTPIRSFVSEKDIEDRRQRRQEEWEKTRKPDDPLEAPEEEYDHRTLFERLQEQKNKKQEEFEESHRLKNMIRGLDNDELSFLAEVDRNRIADEERKEKELSSALDDYKAGVAHLSAVEQEKKIAEFKKSLWSSSSKGDEKKPGPSKRSSQAALLANVVKRKAESSTAETSEATSPKQQNGGVAKVLGVLPGLGCYESDSDESECSSENSGHEEDLVFTMLPRVERVAECAQQAQKK